GGAEVYIHEIAKELVKMGNAVHVFASNDRKSSHMEQIDGVWVIRRGGFYTVYLWAFVYWLLHFRSKFDVVVDSENGIPFFTPLYVGKPVVCLVHHVHQELFRKHLLTPFAILAQFLEARLMPI